MATSNVFCYKKMHRIQTYNLLKLIGMEAKFVKE